MGGEEAKAPALTHGEARELAFDMDDEPRGGLTAPAAVWTIQHGFPVTDFGKRHSLAAQCVEFLAERLRFDDPLPLSAFLGDYPLNTG
jgi:hypothetical protein